MAAADPIEPLLTPWENWTRGPNRPTYLLTRYAILRLLGLLYVVSFLTAIDQGPALLGESGLTPLANLVSAYESRWDGFLAQPSLLWLSPSDGTFLTLSYLGLLLSLAVLAGYASGLTLLLIWVLHTSIVNLGQLWYAFGWEIQLLETGLLAVFLVPFLRGRCLSQRGPPVVVIFLFRWLIVRIMLGAGLIKLRGDPCWTDLTCLAFHYETQPIPNPVSSFLHAMPMWFHQLGVLYNHFCELLVPIFVFAPRRARHIAGLFLLSFQAILIVSGNLSYLNWLTIVPVLACFDDTFYRRLLPRHWRGAIDRRRLSARPTRTMNWAAGGFAIIVAVLSLQIVGNLVSDRQRMNSSFDRLHLVNSYGAFGSVGKARYELVFEGSDASEPGEQDWYEIEFRCKPGDPTRRPCQISPYHYRLDWLIWFAAMGPAERSPWVYHLVYKMLEADPGVVALLAPGQLGNGAPRWIRVWYYSYELQGPLSDDHWKRKRLSAWIPAVSLDTPELIELLRAYGWHP